ncbi:MAG: hypothetical protein AB7O88_14000 [Reyranellaceae bacterium]
MRPILVLGAVLIVAGILALVIPHISFTETRRVVDVGPIKVDAKQERVIPIPAIAGVMAVVAGLGCVYMARKRA